MAIHFDDSLCVEDEQLDTVLTFALTSAPPALRRLLLAFTVGYLIEHGWDPLLAELEVHCRLRRLNL